MTNSPDNEVQGTWHSVAEGRIKHGLKSFTLKLLYTEDYGVTAGLALKVQQAGFDLGGEFERHQSTVWDIAVDFQKG